MGRQRRSNSTSSGNRQGEDEQNVTARRELLNFRFAPRPVVSSNTAPRTGRSVARYSKKRTEHAAMFPLHASAQHAFGLTRCGRPNSKGGGAFYPFLSNHDPVSWDAVQVVHVWTFVVEEYCPICLSTDWVAPRMTKCGHVFCYGCLLRHADSWMESHPYIETHLLPCPCCASPFSIVDCKMMVFLSVQQPRKVGNPKNGAATSTMEFQKLHRHASCPTPYVAATTNAIAHFHVHMAPTQGEKDCKYSHFFYIDVAQHERLLQTHIHQLAKDLAQADDPVTALYVQRALGMVQEELGRFGSIKDQEMARHAEWRLPTSGFYSPIVHPDLFYSPPDDDDKKHNNKYAGSVYAPPEESVFYQSSDGQVLFLHPFNMQCLLEDYDKYPGGSKPPLPDTIHGRILASESLVLTPQLAKRWTFLVHLPLYMDVALVELDIQKYLSGATKKKYGNQMAKRRQQRAAQRQADAKQDKAARQREAALIEDRKAQYYRIDPQDEFFQSSQETEDLDTFLAIQASLSSPQPQEATHSFSFAQAAQGMVVVPNDDQGFPSLASFPALDGGQEKSKVVVVEHEPSAAKSTGQEEQTPQVPSPVKSKRKQKKSKGVSLFSTGGHRSGAY